MNAKFFVPFETAKALKDLGYNEPSTMIYSEEGELQSIGSVAKTNYNENIRERVPIGGVSAPTYYEAVDWLESNRTMFNIFYNKVTRNYDVFIYYPISGLDFSAGETKSSRNREQALNEAILEAIEIVKRRQKYLQQQ